MAIAVKYAADCANPLNALTTVYLEPGSTVHGSDGPFESINVDPCIVPSAHYPTDLITTVPDSQTYCSGSHDSNAITGGNFLSPQYSPTSVGGTSADNSSLVTISGSLVILYGYISNTLTGGQTVTVELYVDGVATGHTIQFLNGVEGAQQLVLSTPIALDTGSRVAFKMTKGTAANAPSANTFVSMGVLVQGTLDISIAQHYRLYGSAAAGGPDFPTPTLTCVCDGPTGDEFVCQSMLVYGPSEVLIYSVRDYTGGAGSMPPPKWYRGGGIQVVGYGARVTVAVERVRLAGVQAQHGGGINMPDNDAIYWFDGSLSTPLIFPQASGIALFENGRIDGGGYFYFQGGSSVATSKTTAAISAGATTFSIASSSGWPASGNIVIGANRAAEETKAFTRSGTTITITTGGGVANAHGTGALVTTPHQDGLAHLNLAIACEDLNDVLIEGLGTAIGSIKVGNNQTIDTSDLPVGGLLTTSAIASGNKYAHMAFPRGDNYVGILVDGGTATPNFETAFNFYGGCRSRIGGRNNGGGSRGGNNSIKFVNYYKGFICGSNVTVDFTLHENTTATRFIASASSWMGFNRRAVGSNSLIATPPGTLTSIAPPDSAILFWDGVSFVNGEIDYDLLAGNGSLSLASIPVAIDSRGAIRATAGGDFGTSTSLYKP